MRIPLWLPSLDELLASRPEFFDWPISTTEVAQFLGRTPAAVVQMRQRGEGPPYHRLPSATPVDSKGRSRGTISYSLREVLSWWMESRITKGKVSGNVLFDLTLVPTNILCDELDRRQRPGVQAFEQRGLYATDKSIAANDDGVPRRSGVAK